MGKKSLIHRYEHCIVVYEVSCQYVILTLNAQENEQKGWQQVLKMKIWIYWSKSNVWIYFYKYLNKNWKIYWSEQSCTGLGAEYLCSSEFHNCKVEETTYSVWLHKVGKSWQPSIGWEQA
jgi:hypothetical protein